MITVNINGDQHVTDDDEPTVIVEFDDHITCAHCRETISDDDGEWRADGSEGSGLVCDGHVLDPPEDAPEHDGLKCGPHEPVTGPQRWCNGAGVAVKEEDDSVEVWVSVGDPRGGFSFTVRRLPDSASDHPGRLIMHVPYPDMGMPHVPIKELQMGTYLIG